MERIVHKTESSLPLLQQLVLRGVIHGTGMYVANSIPILVLVVATHTTSSSYFGPRKVQGSIVRARGRYWLNYGLNLHLLTRTGTSR
eukprot:scaffold105182_cov42-Prasinocladus_malaysianus.AAC.1